MNTRTVTRESTPFVCMYSDRSVRETYRVRVFPNTAQDFDGQLLLVNVTDLDSGLTFPVDTFLLYDFGYTIEWSI